MITLNAPGIWQWDVGHTVSVDSADAIHFAMPGDETALVVEPTGSGTSYTASVPNILLQRSGTLACWKVVDGKSEQMTRIEVKPKPKPADYVYEETTVDDYQQIKEWFTDSVEELEADYTAAIAEVETATDSATDAAASANAAASAAQSAIDAMTGNVLRGTVGPSEVVSVEDAYPQVPLGVKVKGVTRQNLWVNPNGSNNGVIATSNEDGSITVSGTATHRAIISLKSYVLRTGSSYTVSSNGKMSDSWAPGQAESGAGFAVVYRDSSNASQGQAIFGYGDELTTSFVVPSTAAYVEFYVIVEEGATVIGTYRIMLNEGSEAEPWCPPGLNSIEELEIWQGGRNLLGIGSPVRKTGSSSHITYTLNDDGSIRCIGTVTGGDSTSMSALYGNDWNNLPSVVLEPGTYHYETVNGQSLSDGFVLSIRIGNADNYNSHIASNVRGTFTLSKRTRVNAYLTVGQGAENIDVTVWMSITKEDATGERLPYATQSAIPLLGNALRSLPDGTCDVLTIGEDGTAAIERAVFAYTMPTDQADYGWEANLQRSVKPTGVAYVYSTYAQSCRSETVAIREESNGEDEGSYFFPSVNGALYHRIETATDLAANVAIIGGKEVMFKRKTPDSVTLPAATLPALPGPTANVWAVATDGHGNTFTLQPEVELEYARDVTLVIGSLEAKVAALELLHETE